LSIGSDAAGLNVLTNIVGDTTKAYIDNSTINSSSFKGGSVKVRAHEQVDETGYSGAAAGALEGLGVGADVETTKIGNTTQAYITDTSTSNRSTVWGKDVEANALSRENVTTYVAGAGVGLSVGAACSAAGVVVGDLTEAYVAESDVHSNGDLLVLANDKTHINAYAGSLGAGLIAGGGLSIGLISIGNTTKAHM